MSEIPIVAIIANEQTPYRLHLHRRIVREIPEFQLWSLFTHELASSPWSYEECSEIRPVLFGRGESSATALSVASIEREWRKGGTIIQWLIEHNVKAVVLFGYNDAARLRILIWCRRHNRPCFLFGDSNIRGDRATGLRRFIKSIYLPWVIRHATGVFHCGTLGRAYFLKYGAHPDRLYPFPYEPNYQLFAQPDAQGVASIRQRFGFGLDRRRFVFVGRLTTNKRPDLLLEAFTSLAATCPKWDLVIVGDGEMRSTLERDAFTLRGRVCFTGFIDNPADLSSLYALCHVFVLPSDHEPWGVVVTEAAAAGLALITSSAVGASADIVADGANGLVFSPKDPDTLLSAMQTLARDPTLHHIRASSIRVLARWRQSHDPISHLRRALNTALLASPHRNAQSCQYTKHTNTDTE